MYEISITLMEVNTDTTRVLSIDIGIKNLSFCIMEFDIEKHEFDLVHIEKTSIGEVKQTCAVLASALIDFLKSSESINEKPFDYIFIENQLSRAIKNTVLGYSCYSYFYTSSKLKEDGSVTKGLEAMKKFKKKDDISDVFLQAFSLFLDQSKNSGNPIGKKRRRK